MSEATEKIHILLELRTSQYDMSAPSSLQSNRNGRVLTLTIGASISLPRKSIRSIELMNMKRVLTNEFTAVISTHFLRKA